MSQNEKSPLVSCSPIGLFVILLVAALWLGWRLAAPLLDNAYDPKATPRTIVARGDLAADEKATIELFKSASPSVVHIATSARGLARDRYTFNLTPLDIPLGTGSGFVWDDRGYVVTNLHVILNADSRSLADRAEVTLDDQTRYEGHLVGFEADYDIAVLKIDAPKDKMHAIPVGQSADLQVGQKAFAIGNPFGLDHTLSTGVVSGLNREIEAPSGHVIRGVIQTDAAINPGNSGGLLLDSAGRLIGMNTAIASPYGGSAGVGFAVPVDTINRVVPSLIRKGKFSRPVLGIRSVPEQVARAVRVPGVAIETVEPGSGAEKAGLRSLERDAQGRPIVDVITVVAGQRVKTLEEIWEILGDHKAGDIVKIEFVRDGHNMTADVTLQDSG